MDPVTLGIGLGLGAINMGLGAAGKSRQKSLLKKANKITQEGNKKQYELALKKLAQAKSEEERGNVRATRAVDESANDRGILNSSIRRDDQAEREYQYQNRLKALEFAKEGLDNQYFTDQKLAKLKSQLATATDYIGMIQTFINQGAMGVANSLTK